MGKIFYIMGKSSSGKDTIYENLLGRKELLLHPLIMYTTRPIRTGETDGVQYHFVTEEQLKALGQAGKVIELRTYQTVYGPWHYFTADSPDFSEEKLQAAGITRRFSNDADRERCMDEVASYIGTILEK